VEKKLKCFPIIKQEYSTFQYFIECADGKHFVSGVEEEEGEL
jgi:hypothetical protein